MTVNATTSSAATTTTPPAPAAAPAAPKAADAAGTAETTAATPSRAEQAHRIVKRNVYWAIGAGLVPMPVADFVAMTAVQVKLLKELADHYQVSFFEDKAKKIVGALVAGTGSLAVAGMVARSLIKFVPVVGQVVGAVSVPALSGALTLAIGNLFVMHFESGGTLLDFDIEKMRAHFQKELESAKASVTQMQNEKKGTAPIAP